MDTLLEHTVVGIAHALFLNRLHVLRLTEVYRMGIRPDHGDDDVMEVPDSVDAELRQQAIDYVITCLPEEFHVAIHAAKVDWLRPA